MPAWFEDREPPEYIGSENGVALWVRRIIWVSGPDSGHGGYIASLRTPGNVRDSGILPNRYTALTEGRAELARMVAEYYEKIAKAKGN